MDSSEGDGLVEVRITLTSAASLRMYLEFSTALLLNYVLILARTSGFIVFVPIPGIRHGPGPARVVLAVVLAVLLAPFAWGTADPEILNSPAVSWKLAGLIFSESAFGMAVGAAVSLLLEVFGLAAQILGFQAGYSYVNMVDPTTQVDASILNVILALLGSLLFLAFDLHLHLIRALIATFTSWPVGHFAAQPRDALMVIELGQSVMEAAVRIAFPIVAVLLLIDLTLALLNQINNRLQLLTLAFPAKIVAAIALLVPLTATAPRVFHDLAEQAQQVVQALALR